MKKIVIALALSLAASGAAFAKSGALDVTKFEPVKQSAIDYTPTASVGAANEFETRAKLGDGSPQYVKRAVSGIDYSATGSIGMAGSGEHRDRLGDGSPQYK